MCQVFWNVFIIERTQFPYQNLSRETIPAKSRWSSDSCFLHIVRWFIFAKFHENIFNGLKLWSTFNFDIKDNLVAQFQQNCMLSYGSCLMILYMCIKIMKISSVVFNVIEQTQILNWKNTKGHRFIKEISCVMEHLLFSAHCLILL